MDINSDRYVDEFKRIQTERYNKEKEESVNDNIKHPDHYTQGPIETIEVIKGTVKDHVSYLHGNIIKYILRAFHKGGLEDFKKARVYLDWLIRELEGPAPPVIPAKAGIQD